jgi:phosphoribosyl-AMP cyclohydrolase
MAELEDTREFRPSFDEHGLIGAIVADASDNSVLMFAFMNAEALRLTRETGFAHFWSRSRNRLWKKGETSGETLRVTDILVDCDQDALLIKVEPQGRGAACHTGRRSCFYRRLDGSGLEFVGDAPVFDPATVYKQA